MIVDTALHELETTGHPIRVGMVGSGASARAIALQLGTPVTRNSPRGDRESDARAWRNGHSGRPGSQCGVVQGLLGEAETAINNGFPVLTDDPSVLTCCDAIDVLVEVTGTIEAAAQVALEAFDHGKH